MLCIWLGLKRMLWLARSSIQITGAFSISAAVLGFYSSHVPWSPKDFSFASTTWLLMQDTYIRSYPSFLSAFFSNLMILNFDLKREKCGAFFTFTLRARCRVINLPDNTIGFFSWNRGTEERKDHLTLGRGHRLDTQTLLSLTSQTDECDAFKTTAVVMSKI